uniref:Uncharacterized protein n=2 Tax=Oryza TaxID=4527 RepID=A0A0E0DYE0_9ORYZ
MFAILVAVTFAQILGILTGRFAPGATATAAAAGYDDHPHPVLRMAVSVLTVTVPATFYLGVMQLYARVAPPVAPAPLRRRLADLAWSMAWTTVVVGLPPLAVLLLELDLTGHHA